MEHLFTAKIIEILESHYGSSATTIFEISPLLKYINYKTRSANRGSKSRSSFANLYALYVLIQDYMENGFDVRGGYSKYEGADFAPLLNRMRELPFGRKLQNHALNNRANDEFHKYFPEEDRRPILRRVDIQKYWINESLLTVSISGTPINIAKSIIEIIDAYVNAKKQSFEQFISDCQSLKNLYSKQDRQISDFIKRLIAPERDARVFEIVSYAVLKHYYSEQIIFIGAAPDNVKPENFCLYKTGRTNANDGGIDFVMRPKGRFFQVTETLDVKKYFLDIDKIERFPISFVVKSSMPKEEIEKRLEEGARDQYTVETVVRKYMAAIEEIINIPRLLEIFDEVENKGHLKEVLDEIIKWSMVEFNYLDADGGEPGTSTDEEENEA